MKQFARKTINSSFAFLFVFTLTGCGGGGKTTPMVLVVDDEEQVAAGFDARALAPIAQPTAPQPIPFKRGEAKSDAAAEPVTKIKVPISGTVQDADGKPASGSTVVATTADTILATAKSNAAGDFILGDVEISVLPKSVYRALPVGSLRIVAVSPTRCISGPVIAHYFDADRPANPMAQGYYRGDSIKANLKHHKTGSVKYQLLDETGQPVARARIFLLQLVGPGINQWDYEGWHDPAFETMTGPDGRFELANVPVSGFVRFQAEGPGFAATEIWGFANSPEQSKTATAWGSPQSGDTWVVKLQKPKPLKFQVTSKKFGRPIEGAEVTAQKASTNGEPVRPQATARTDANGFAVLLLPPGVYDVVAVADSKSVNIMSAPNQNLTQEKTVEFQLPPVYNITLEALDVDTGKPIAGVKIVFHYKHATAINVGRGPDVQGTTTGKAPLGPTGADGRFRWNRPDQKLFGLSGSPTLQDMRFEVVESPGYVSVGIPTPRWDPGSGKQALFRFTFKKGL